MEKRILEFFPISIPKLNDTDMISSSMLIGNNGLVIGTKNGRCIFQFFNENGSLSINEFQTMDGKIKSLSVDNSQRNFLFISNNIDNTSKFQIVCINGLEMPLNFAIETGEFEKKIVACSICPNYSENNSFVFATSDGSIYICKKRTFSLKIFGKGKNNLYFEQIFKRKDNSNEKIFRILWIKNYIFWISSSSIKAVEENNVKSLLYDIQPPITVNNQKQCGFVDLHNSKQEIGVYFGKFFYIINFRKNGHEILVNLKKEIIAMAVTDSAIIHISLQNDKYKYNEQNNNQNKENYKNNNDYEKESSYEFFVDQNYVTNSISPPSDIFTHDSKIINFSLFNEKDFIIVFAKKAYKICLISEVDRFRFLIREHFNETIILNNFNTIIPSLSDDERILLIIETITDFINMKKVEKAVEICTRFLRHAKKEWDSVICVFSEKNSLSSLSSFIPFEIIKFLENRKAVILNLLLTLDAQRFCYVFEALPKECFNDNSIICEIRKKADIEKVFNIPLALIFLYRHEFKNAFISALKVGYRNIFDHIDQYTNGENAQQLYDAALEHFDDLCRTCGEIFSRFLLLHHGNMKPSIIMNKFKQNVSKDSGNISENMFYYMNQLYHQNIEIPKNSKSEFATEYAKLLLKYHSIETMNFLKTNKHFDDNVIKQAAIDEKMYYAAAYLTGKNGAALDGMRIYINYIKNWKDAIEYANEVKTEETYSMLIQEAYNNPDLLLCMLQNLSSLSIDHVKFIKEIPEDQWKDEYNVLTDEIINEMKRNLTTKKLISRIISDSGFEIFNQNFSSNRRGTIKKKNT